MFGQADNSVNQRGMEIELKLKDDGDRPILQEPEKPIVQKPVDKPIVQRPGDKPILNRPEDKPLEQEEAREERSYVVDFKPTTTSNFGEDKKKENLFAEDDEFKVGNEIACRSNHKR